MTKHCKLEHFYEIGTVYSEEYILHIKIELEVKFGTQIITLSNGADLKLVCKHRELKDCNFQLKFARKWGVNKECGYELVKVNDKHRESCVYDAEEHAFQRNRQFLMDNKERIALILLERIEMFGLEHPKKLMEVLATQFHKANQFIYEGIENKYLRRRIKKKFDNLIAELKRSLAPKEILKNKITNAKRHIKRRRLFSNYPISPHKKDSLDLVENIMPSSSSQQLIEERDSEFKINRKGEKHLKYKNCQRSRNLRKEQNLIKREYERMMQGLKDTERSISSYLNDGSKENQLQVKIEDDDSQQNNEN